MRSRRPAATGRATGCASSTTIRPTSTGSTTSSQTRRSGSSSTRWPSSSSAPSRGAWESYGRVNANVADAVLEELEEDPDTAVWFHDYHLYLAPAVVRAARPDATLSHFVHIPGRGRTAWSRAAGAMARARSTRGCSRTTSSASTRAAGGSSFLDSVAARFSAEVDLPARHRPSDLGRPARVRRAGRGAPAVLAAERELEAIRGEHVGAARRPHRPVEEHRPRLRGVRALPRAPSGGARPGRDARAARPVAAGHPAVRRVPRGGRRRVARRQRAVRRGRAGCRSSWRSRTTSRARSPRTSSTTCCSSTRSSTG